MENFIFCAVSVKVKSIEAESVDDIQVSLFLALNKYLSIGKFGIKWKVFVRSTTFPKKIMPL